MDENTKIHPDATDIYSGETTDPRENEQIGWKYTHQGYFDYEAVKTDDCISVYVLWGDDQPGDMYSFDRWYEVARDLAMLLRIASTDMPKSKV